MRMSEIPQYAGRLLEAPSEIPEHVLCSMPKVANLLGFPDASDGVLNIGNIEIRTPHEEAVSSQSYVPTLLEIQDRQRYLPSNLARDLATKIACGSLGAHEHAVMAFGFKNTQQLRELSMPLLKDNWRFALDSLKFAAKHGFVTRKETYYKKERTQKFLWKGVMVTKTQQDSYSGVVADLCKINLEAVPEQGSTPLAPSLAHRQYVEQYGGLLLGDADPQSIRDELKRRYEQDLQGRIYYPDPLHALASIYKGGRSWLSRKDAWRDVKAKYNPALSKKERRTLPIHCKRGGPYILETVGITAKAAHQAGARLILDHIGATNLKLLV